MKKVFSAAGAVIFCLSVLFTGCSSSVDSPSNPDDSSQGGTVTQEETGVNRGKGVNSKDPFPEPEYSNVPYSSSSAASLDFIFNNQSLGTTTIVIKRSEWDQLCDDYRYFYKNENCVHAEAYIYEKDGQSWTMKNVGFRLRGNTSRYCPQGIDNGNAQGQMNVDWNSSYYAYANQPNKDYRQCHFKVDFEEFLPDGQDQKMSNCMKGVALKRMDNSCAREIFCYDFFRRNGIWTAPRASHTRLILKIREDKDDNSTTTVDFGVYEMFEEINKQSLKARASKNNENTAAIAWKNNNGNLWKCQNDLTNPATSQMGVEDIRIIYAGEEVPQGMQTNNREDSKRVGYIWKGYNLDLKTNKSSLSTAQTQLSNFISGLNALPTPSSDSDATSIDTIKAFYETKFGNSDSDDDGISDGIDFFIKTYAINIICGMDDDYWGNANNYYLYFGEDKNGTDRVYFIPFDYDNTLGASIKEGGFKHNPLDWGRGANRPLIDKLLSVPEYKQKLVNYLHDLTAADSDWNYTRCSNLFKYWQNMLKPYINSPHLSYTGLGVNSFSYNTWTPGGYDLVNQANNIYDATRESFEKYRTGNYLRIQDADDSTFNGIKINISHIPDGAAIRRVYIKDLSETNAQFRQVADSSVQTIVDATEFGYPFTVSGTQYSIYVEYLNSAYVSLDISEPVTITATGGAGKLYVDSPVAFNPATMISNNKLIYQPVIKLGNNPAPLPDYSNWAAYYVIEIEAGDWQYQSWNHVSPTCNNFDFAAYDVDDAGNHNYRVASNYRNSQIFFTLYYVIKADAMQALSEMLGVDCSAYGDYRLVIWTYDETREHSFQLQ